MGAGRAGGTHFRRGARPKPLRENAQVPGRQRGRDNALSIAADNAVSISPLPLAAVLLIRPYALERSVAPALRRLTRKPPSIAHSRPTFPDVFTAALLVSQQHAGRAMASPLVRSKSKALTLLCGREIAHSPDCQPTYHSLPS